ncbi:CAP domain-containing protein, partial [Lysinibacillus fusiformis]|nr:CAP domain-containing protein [Lysinibacillus fusiformis]
EGNSVKQTTNCKVYYKWSNNHKWNIQFPQASTPSKETPTTNNNNTATTPNNNQSSQNEKPATPPTSSTPSTTTSDVNAFEQEVVKLTNAERTKAGLSPLQTDDKLMAAAREKSQDMQSNNYFSHTSPTFGSPFDRMKALGIAYKSAGENIAQGQRSPQEVVQAWMDSPGHRANILNGKFTHIGVGYVKSGNYWTQQFITK